VAEKKNILYKEESYRITGCAMEVINELGHGYNEKVYENALAVEFGLYTKLKWERVVL